MKTISNHIPTDNCCYIVREAWPDQVIDHHHPREYMFFSPVKAFHKDTWQDSKNAAEMFFAERIKLITLRKLMFPDIDKQHFTLILSFAESEIDIDQKEFVIKEVNNQIISQSENYKAGLFRK